MQLESPKRLERKVYESALVRMEAMGSSAIMHPHLIEKRDAIKSSLLEYYESTEEYEKCKYINDFFDKLEKEISLKSLVDSLEQSKSED
jgi:hypothetical protein